MGGESPIEGAECLLHRCFDRVHEDAGFSWLMERLIIRLAVLLNVGGQVFIRITGPISSHDPDLFGAYLLSRSSSVLRRLKANRMNEGEPRGFPSRRCEDD